MASPHSTVKHGTTHNSAAPHGTTQRERSSLSPYSARQPSPQATKRCAQPHHHLPKTKRQKPTTPSFRYTFQDSTNLTPSKNKQKQTKTDKTGSRFQSLKSQKTQSIPLRCTNTHPCCAVRRVKQIQTQPAHLLDSARRDFSPSPRPRKKHTRSINARRLVSPSGRTADQGGGAQAQAQTIAPAQAQALTCKRFAYPQKKNKSSREPRAPSQTVSWAPPLPPPPATRHSMAWHGMARQRR